VTNQRLLVPPSKKKTVGGIDLSSLEGVGNHRSREQDQSLLGKLHNQRVQQQEQEKQDLWCLPQEEK
jgi:hypothetical protein